MFDVTALMTSNGPFDASPGDKEMIVWQHIAEGQLLEAAAALEDAFDAGWRDYYRSRNHPVWREAFRSPEFEPVMAKVKADLDRQRRLVEQADAKDDFRAEFQKLTQRFGE